MRHVHPNNGDTNQLKGEPIVVPDANSFLLGRLNTVASDCDRKGPDVVLAIRSEQESGGMIDHPPVPGANAHHQNDEKKVTEIVSTFHESATPRDDHNGGAKDCRTCCDCGSNFGDHRGGNRSPSERRSHALRISDHVRGSMLRMSRRLDQPRRVNRWPMQSIPDYGGHD